MEFAYSNNLLQNMNHERYSQMPPWLCRSISQYVFQRQLVPWDTNLRDLFMPSPLPKKPFTAKLNLHVSQGASPMPTSWRHFLWPFFNNISHTTWQVWFLLGGSRQLPPKRNLSCPHTRERPKASEHLWELSVYFSTTPQHNSKEHC